MKVLGINIYNKNNYNYSVNSSPVLTFGKQTNNMLERNPVRDKVSFTSKIPSIMAPTMEDLINKTKAVDILRYNVLRLAKYDIPCPVCGHIMLDLDKFTEFEKNVMGTTETSKIISYISKLKRYMHPVEAKIFEMIREDSRLCKTNSLYESLKIRLQRSERKIIIVQSKIFANIGILSRSLPEKERINVQNLLNETFARILDPRETSRFSRRIFIDKLKHIFIPENERTKLRKLIESEFEKKYGSSENWTLSEMIEYVSERLEYEISNWIYTPEQAQIIDEAVKLPMAYNNVDAFIVKYAKRDYEGANPDQKIAIRMLSNSLATVEHIKPQSKRGATEPKNLALECACDNNRKGSQPVIEQIIENPMMPYNYRVYMNKLCELHLKNVLEKSYITLQNKTYRTESYGILDADLSKLNDYKRAKQRHKYNQNDDRTMTKAERRAARKLKLKNKKNKNKSKLNQMFKDESGIVTKCNERVKKPKVY